jgi:hypothetical protein
VLHSRHAVRRRIICGLAALCFVLLASLAATHLHIGAGADEACAVCAAVAGKIAGPSASPAAKVTFETVTWLVGVASRQVPVFTLAVVLPPSCGPPD